MKTKYLFVLSLVVGCLGFTAIENIRWEWSKEGSTKVEFGLRSDGVVVWREITNTTNSPAEKIKMYYWPDTTNIWTTNNLIFNGLSVTNVIINN